MNGFSNYFSIEYFFTLAFLYWVSIFYFLGGEKGFDSDNPHRSKPGDLNAFWIFPFMNAFLLLIFAIFNLVLDIGIGYRETLWYIAKYLTALFVVWSFFFRLKSYKEWIKNQEDEFKSKLNSIKRKKSSMLKTVTKTIEDIDKLKSSSAVKYEDKINQYKINYQNLIDTIVSEEVILAEIVKDHPRIAEIIQNRGIGDSNKFIEKKELIFAKTNLKHHKNNLRDFKNDPFFGPLNDNLIKFKELLYK